MPAGRALLAAAPTDSARLVAWASLVLLPLAGFLVLLAAPGADPRLENHPAHFWVVLGAAVTSAGLALSTAGVALRRADARVGLYAFACLAAFGAIAWAARREDPEERFSDLYLDETAAGKRDVSVLFADLQGFTSFSEGRDPREVSEMLNAYFRVAIPPIVREHGGDVDRLMGDAIMATWGTRGDPPDHARRAVRAALALQRETARIAEEHPGWPRFRAAPCG